MTHFSFLSFVPSVLMGRTKPDEHDIVASQLRTEFPYETHEHIKYLLSTGQIYGGSK